jgi:hypothetical protein
MAISRMQEPRQNYGLGSFVKKVTKKITKPFTKIASKIVPKEIAGIMRVAAPFLPPGYREAAYLLGTAKQTGRISPMDLALTAAPTFFKETKMGQGIKTKVGNFTLPGMDKNLSQLAVGSPEKFAMGNEADGLISVADSTKGFFGTGGEFNLLKGSMLTKPDGSLSLSKAGGIGVGLLSLIQSASTPEEAGNAYANATGNSDDYQRGYDMFNTLDTNAFKIDDQYIQQAANGGLMRTNYAMGSDDEPKPLPNDPTEPVNPFRPKPIGPFPSKMADMKSYSDYYKNLDLEEALRTFRMLKERDPEDMEELIQFFKDRKINAAEGGLMRENFALGTRPTAQESGLGGLPIEADMRYTGGFMPYGAVEKADDVPARLSKNEFVFTADAVRAAGGGSVQKGAKKMYDTMKQLEQQPEAKGAMA